MLPFQKRVHRLLDQVDFPKLVPGEVLVQCNSSATATLEWSAQLPDAITGQVKPQYGRQWLLHADMSDRQIVNTLLLMVLTFMEHELRESFKFRGRNLYRPYH